MQLCVRHVLILVQEFYETILLVAAWEPSEENDGRGKDKLHAA